MFVASFFVRFLPKAIREWSYLPDAMLFLGLGAMIAAMFRAYHRLRVDYSRALKRPSRLDPIEVSIENHRSLTFAAVIAAYGDDKTQVGTLLDVFISELHIVNNDAQPTKLLRAWCQLNEARLIVERECRLDGPQEIGARRDITCRLRYAALFEGDLRKLGGSNRVMVFVRVTGLGTFQCVLPEWAYAPQDERLSEHAEDGE